MAVEHSIKDLTKNDSSLNKSAPLSSGDEKKVTSQFFSASSTAAAPSINLQLKSQRYGLSDKAVDPLFRNPSGYSCKLISTSQGSLKDKEIGFFMQEGKIFCKVTLKPSPLEISNQQILNILKPKIAETSDAAFTEEERDEILRFLASSEVRYIPPLPYYTHAAHEVMVAHESAFNNYRASRENGDDRDNPERSFPKDGTLKWEKPDANGDAKARYTGGPVDELWMGDKDRNYINRLTHEEKLKEKKAASLPIFSTELKQ
jgi:hypothetical protein